MAQARLPEFTQKLERRLKIPTTIINPFVSAVALDQSTLDREAELPSPLTTVIGAAICSDIELDGLSQPKREKSQFWRTKGCLRAAAVIAASLLIMLAANQNLTVTHLSERDAALSSPSGGNLVPHAQNVHQSLAATTKEIDDLKAKVLYLDGERRPGRIANEFLRLFADIQDPQACPVSLDSIQVQRSGRGMTILEMSGSAASVGSQSAGQVLNYLEQELVNRHSAILAENMETLPTAVGQTGSALPFAYRIRFPDRK